MNTLLKRRVVVLCGFGDFSRRVASGIVALPQADCILGLPPGAQATGFSQRVGAPFMVLDPNDPSSLQRLLDGAFVVVNLRGPFSSRGDLAVAARCATHGVHYLDPADSREYHAEFLRLTRDAREHDALLVTGTGAAPAVTMALAELLASEFDRVNEIHVFITPGMGDQRELAIARAILEYEHVRVKERGRWHERRWWQQPQIVRFPAPLGRRRGYLCDLPDLDSLAKQFNPGTVTVRAGFGSGSLSLTLATLAFMRGKGWVKQMSPMARAAVRAAAARPAPTRAKAAAVRIVMRGTQRGSEQEHVASLVARDGSGPAVAAAPTLALVRKWLARGVEQTGAISAAGLLRFDELKPELIGYDVVLVRE